MGTCEPSFQTPRTGVGSQPRFTAAGAPMHRRLNRACKAGVLRSAGQPQRRACNAGSKSRSRKSPDKRHEVRYLCMFGQSLVIRARWLTSKGLPPTTVVCSWSCSQKWAHAAMHFPAYVQHEQCKESPYAKCNVDPQCLLPDLSSEPPLRRSLVHLPGWKAPRRRPTCKPCICVLNC
jgi:hypothetical protein